MFFYAFVRYPLFFRPVSATRPTPSGVRPYSYRQPLFIPMSSPRSRTFSVGRSSSNSRSKSNNSNTSRNDFGSRSTSIGRSQGGRGGLNGSGNSTVESSTQSRSVGAGGGGAAGVGRAAAQKHQLKRSSSRDAAAAAAARCAPTPPRRGRSNSHCGGSRATPKIDGGDGAGAAAGACAVGGRSRAGTDASIDVRQQQQPSIQRPVVPTAATVGAAAVFSVGVTTATSAATGQGPRKSAVSKPPPAAAPTVPAASGTATATETAAVGATAEVGRGNELHELLVGRAREFAEQGRAEVLVGMPREATRSFSSALKIVAPRKVMRGWASVNVELLLARAQVLSGLGKHEACAEVRSCVRARI